MSIINIPKVTDQDKVKFFDEIYPLLRACDLKEAAYAMATVKSLYRKAQGSNQLVLAVPPDILAFIDLEFAVRGFFEEGS